MTTEPYDSERLGRELLPPPRLLSHGELLPVIEPPLRDLALPLGADQIEEWEPFASTPGQGLLTDDLAQRAEEVSLRDERVRALLSDKRYVAIGPSVVGGEGKRAGGIIYVFYNYDDNVAIEVSLNDSASQTFGAEAVSYQPAPLESEVEHAIGLARRDQRLEAAALEGLEGMAILVSRYDPADRLFMHRLFDVRFGCPNERLPRYSALVDLSTETVLSAGQGC